MDMPSFTGLIGLCQEGFFNASCHHSVKPITDPIFKSSPGKNVAVCNDENPDHQE